jgi:pimeloyl-ACP methyl ester carboxylesterase
MQPGPVQYTTVGDSQVAYQVTGEGGGIDFVYMIGQGSAFELWWDYKPFAKCFERWASLGRLILFDRRGTGFSDRPPIDSLPSWEHFAEDLEAVLDAARSEQAVICAAFDGGPVALTFAATNPHRVRALILFNSFARWYSADDYPGAPPDSAGVVAESLKDLWGTDALARVIAADEADDPEAIRWLARSLRASHTPNSFVQISRKDFLVDARPALPLIKAPTLVLQRSEYAMSPPDLARYMADRIEGARFVEVPGRSAGIWGVASDRILDTIEEFVTGSKPTAPVDRVLATVLFTDIVGSTERAASLGDARWKQVLRTHDDTARDVLASWRGDVVKTTGDGLLAKFDGPGRAIQCTQELARQLRHQDLEIRSGIHVGEIELRENDDIGGIAVHIAARVMAKAGAGELLCSRTVKDLTAGSGIEFEDRGTHELKGVPDSWQLFAVTTH